MAQNIFNLDEESNKILGIVKAQHGLKNKNQAIGFILKVYGENFLEPEIRPEFLKKLQKIKRQEGIKFKDVEGLRNHIRKNA